MHIHIIHIHIHYTYTYTHTYTCTQLSAGSFPLRFIRPISLLAFRNSNDNNDNNNNNNDNDNEYNSDNDTINIIIKKHYSIKSEHASVLDFRGFDSGVILRLRGGTLRSARGFPGKFESSNVSRRTPGLHNKIPA